MTFEEWKEKHNDLIENVAITFFNYGKGVDTKTCYDELEYLLKRAFKAGRPKWHKVADGDLPKHCRYGTRTSEYVLVKFKSSNTSVCYFDFDLSGWFANGYPERLKNIIAWCEVPKYTEE